MTRVSTFAQSQAWLTQFMKANSQAFQLQQQVSTGKKVQSFDELGRDTAPLMAAKGVEARLEQYQRTGDAVLRRLDIQNMHLESLGETAQELREAALDAVSTGKGIGLMERVTNVFESVVSVLNTTISGDYIYGGTRTDTAPVSIDSVSDLVALTASGDAFQNSQTKLSAQIDTGRTLEYTLLADDIGGDLMASLKRIADFNAGTNGPFSNDLTDAQESFLMTELANLASLVESQNAFTAENGMRYQDTERLMQEQGELETQIKGFISDIEDVDLAEAVTRLEQNQTAIEASARVFASLSRTSLLDYI